MMTYLGYLMGAFIVFMLGFGLGGRNLRKIAPTATARDRAMTCAAQNADSGTARARHDHILCLCVLGWLATDCPDIFCPLATAHYHPRMVGPSC